jgi:hypothetical protein
MTNTPTSIPTDIPSEKKQISPEQKQKAAQLVAEKREKDRAAAKERLEGLTWEQLSPMEKTLLEGALQKDTVEDGVRRIYDNMHHTTGWTYCAGDGSVSGSPFTRGGKTVGMCQGYREAFADALTSYDALRKKTGSEPVKNGKLEIKPGNDLSNKLFCTKEGLTLMGGLKGNVYCKVNGKTSELMADGIDTINRFVFQYHWTLNVNGVFYDPIFPGTIGGAKDNVEWELGGPGQKKYMSDDGNRFVPNRNRGSTNGEFATTFIWVTDWPVFAAIVDAMRHLYNPSEDDPNKKDIDAILTGKKASTWSKNQHQWHDLAQKIVQENVKDQDTFLTVATAANDPMLGFLTKAQFEAMRKILDLAAK